MAGARTEAGAGTAARGIVIWLTGLSGAGRTTLAQALATRLRQRERFAMVLDGDRMRGGLSRDPGFGERDRFENVRRIAEVAALVAEAGGVAVVATREQARAVIGDAYREVYVDTALGVCEARDPKALHARARRGELPGFTGLTAPYEPPPAPDLVLDTCAGGRDVGIDALLRFTLEAR
ncbi:adenylyl-sulfate kinase [Burkholderia plantarii]|uniref:adenylyl-sulfate kinase n=1 Tax=Burkholderia plantarii TaxID=41899 RepID=UPI001F5B9B2A|nr:adenylyl-sulfate kinase [Burkholderia plantarii]